MLFILKDAFIDVQKHKQLIWLSIVDDVTIQGCNDTYTSVADTNTGCTFINVQKDFTPNYQHFLQNNYSRSCACYH